MMAISSGRGPGLQAAAHGRSSAGYAGIGPAYRTSISTLIMRTSLARAGRRPWMSAPRGHSHAADTSASCRTRSAARRLLKPRTAAIIASMRAVRDCQLRGLSGPGTHSPRSSRALTPRGTCRSRARRAATDLIPFEIVRAQAGELLPPLDRLSPAAGLPGAACRSPRRAAGRTAATSRGPRSGLAKSEAWSQSSRACTHPLRDNIPHTGIPPGKSGMRAAGVVAATQSRARSICPFGSRLASP